MMQRKIRSIHQIEITSRCNLRCKYCIHPKMERPKVDMDIDTYKKTLEHVAFCVKNFGQRELNICGIGESTLHPQFAEFVELGRKALGPAGLLVLSTNGIEITEDLVKSLMLYRPRFYVSMHRPEKAGHAVEILKKYGMLLGIDANAAVSATDWAGQVDWFVSTPNRQCMWVPEGKVFVDSLGNVRTCCFDGNGKFSIGNVFDENILDRKTMPYVLCNTCHQNSNLGLNDE